MARKAKEKSTPELYWNELVSVYFDFCREKFNEDPSFDGSSPRDMKSIVKSLRERAEKNNIEWTLDTAKFRFHKFLDFSFQDSWLSKNFLLFNINRQKDKIFYNIRAAINKQQLNPFN